MKGGKATRILLVVCAIFLVVLLAEGIYYFFYQKSRNQKLPSQTSTETGSGVGNLECGVAGNTGCPSPGKQIEAEGVMNYRSSGGSKELSSYEGKVISIRGRTLTIERMGETNDIDIPIETEIALIKIDAGGAGIEITEIDIDDIEIGDSVSYSLPKQTGRGSLSVKKFNHD
jgi:hypothetical protein